MLFNLLIELRSFNPEHLSCFTINYTFSRVIINVSPSLDLMLGVGVEGPVNFLLTSTNVAPRKFPINIFGKKEERTKEKERGKEMREM